MVKKETDKARLYIYPSSFKEIKLIQVALEFKSQVELIDDMIKVYKKAKGLKF
ncbi:MAG: hypothetical protein WD512_10585 [Candidatus Paceibacterota bacterium]